MVALFILGIAGIFVFGYFVGRNNPNLKAVNKILSTGKAVISAGGQVVAAAKK